MAPASHYTKGDITTMPGTYKVLELVGTSRVSFAEAVKAGVAEAAKTIRHLDWFEVVEQRGKITEGKVQEFQVALKIGFKVER
jgi:flavin-binding protein dodecin